MKNTPYTPIRIPKTIVCDKCGKQFETLGNDTTCVQCMIKPSRPMVIVVAKNSNHTQPLQKPKEMEPTMPQSAVHKEKNCIDCQKFFVPTGQNQKRCPECAAKKNSGTHPKTAKVGVPHPFGNDVKTPKTTLARTASAPAITVICTMQDTIAIFHTLADTGCTCLVFGNMKIGIEKI